MAVSYRHRYPQSEFSSLFRLLDDWESHRAALGGTGAAGTSFSPRFDVRETKDTYLLDGELPGINQRDINIEFTDPHTLVINGRAERAYHMGYPPGRKAEEEGELSRAGGKQHKATWDEEGHKYWVSERSVGEFQRTFNFPTRVDQDNVKARLHEGVLSVTIPKAGTPMMKKVAIEHQCNV
ncbi:hypothetical protein VTO42DRAFT_7525 [Malbranchea cinnamomea]